MLSDTLDMREIARCHYDDVYRFCARRIGVDLAADAAQETFLTAQKVLRRFEGRSTLRTWLLGIALNECRRQSRMRRVHSLPGDFDMADGCDYERSWVDREALREALAKLSPEHREAVLLHEVEGLTYDEAAQVLGVPSGTVKSRLHHAFLNLRKVLRAPLGEQA
jgi:RNA polymerase sigma-70 factor, ECF subfamily